VIVLDTHIWVWWVDGGAQLPADVLAYVEAEKSQGPGVCAISCWEVAKLVELGRLQLALPLDQWVEQALQSPVQLLSLTPEVAVESSRLPQPFHRDPADQMIVATARLYGWKLVTLDRAIRAYPHVQIAP